jgi:RNA 2',3'-cyclic 3'-phosphodiesterase
MIRLFAAVPVPDDIAELLVARQTGVAGARWRPLEALHITLRFFGDIPEDKAEDVDAELAAIAVQPFDLELQGAGAFGEGRDIQALWAGVADSPPLRRLAERCETAARRAGLKPVTRNYHPHVTLAYVTRPDPHEAAAWIQTNNLLRTEPFRVTWFSLYSSRLMPGGSRYEVERDYPLLG